MNAAFNASLLLLVSEDNHRYLTWLKSHYERNGIADIFESIDKTEKYKMKSRMYRYNSRWLEILVDIMHPISVARNDGFGPLSGEMDKTKVHLETIVKQDYNFDDLKIGYLNRLIDESQESKLYIFVSPIWYGMDTLQFEPIRKICQERGVPFIDFSNDPKYVHHDEYFKDGNHMNERGADEFAKDFISLINR